MDFMNRLDFDQILRPETINLSIKCFHAMAGSNITDAMSCSRGQPDTTLSSI